MTGSLYSSHAALRTTSVRRGVDVLTARTDLHLAARDEAKTPAGILIAIGAIAVVAAAAVAGQVPVADAGVRLAVMAAAIAAYAAFSFDIVAIAAVVPLAWLVQDGFLLDRYGVLVWRGWSDLARLGLLVAAALLGLAVGALRRHEIGAGRG
jgi:hypothetical protein